MPVVEGRRQVAAVPRTKTTGLWWDAWLARMTAGIEIALVDARGNVFDVRPETEEGCRAS
jgi:hypothetical protein